MTIVELHMNIDCDGCEDKVRKALLKLEGVHDVNVDRLRGKVTVTGSTSEKKVLRAARRTGKLAVLWPSAYNNNSSPAYLHAAYARPANYYHHQSYHAAAEQHRRHYGNDSGVSAVGRRPAAQPQHPNNKAMSSYNYHVHGYFNSDLYGSQQHEVVPAAVGSYFSDENPSACWIM